MSTRPPNLVFILTDQQRADTIGEWGHAHMRTPHLDRLAREGFSFRNCFCPGATCTPSRAAIFTGRQAHNTGAYSFHHWGHQRTWVQDLADAGYWCVNMGKMHFQPRDVSGGFHERVIVENPTSVSTWGGNGDDAWGKFLAYHGRTRPNHRHRSDPAWRDRWQGVPWTDGEFLHSDAFVADSTVAWLRQRPASEAPFFLQVGFPGPHEPWDAPPRFLALYDDAAMPAPVDFPPDYSRRPPQHEALRHFHATCDHESRIDMPAATPADIDRMQRHYFAKISWVDHQIGKVLAGLKDWGHLDNTIVVVCSDHGEMLGDHGGAYKWLMYDCITRVPLIVRDFRAPAAARTTSDLVSAIDLGPTLLEWAGVPVPTRLEGRSLAPYLRGEPVAPRRAVYCEDNYMVMMRTPDEKIVHYLGAPYGEYYDLASDPQEARNLWHEPAHRARRDELRLALLDSLAVSAYQDHGHKTQQDEAGAYPIRWHDAPAPTLHGPVPDTGRAWLH